MIPVLEQATSFRALEGAATVLNKYVLLGSAGL
jgi:hypothetical protein